MKQIGYLVSHLEANLGVYHVLTKQYILAICFLGKNIPFCNDKKPMSF